jgi:predicted AAA+ superfamily ATPase
MKDLIIRKIIKKIEPLLFDKEIIVLHGSRQVGKTSVLKYIMQHCLKKALPPQNIVYFDLEDIFLLEVCNKGVKHTLDYLKSLGCDFQQRIFLFIDEIQYLDNPSSFLKLFCDHYGDKVKLMVSGSSSFAIKSKFKNSLVGRTFEFELFGLDFEEFLWFKNLNYNIQEPLSTSLDTPLKDLFKEFILYGAYPRVTLTDSIEKKELILKQILNTYVRRDIFDLANIKNIKTFNNLISVLASQSSQILNISELSNSLRIGRETLESYLFILENTYIIKLIQPFFRNIRSEVTKMPKIFFEDTGMMNLLINKTFSKELSGQLFETGVYSLLRKNMDVQNLNYWRTSKGHEVDFVVEKQPQDLTAFEVKIRFNNQRLTSLKYLNKAYHPSKQFLVTLDKILEPPPGITLSYPWQLYPQFLG